MTDHTTTPTPDEYFYCGVTIDRTGDTFYTCNRRIGHTGECGPDRDPHPGRDIDTVTIPAEHVDTITDALRHRLSDYGEAKGIGESTAFGFILRALLWAQGHAAAREPAPFATEIRQLIKTHGPRAVAAEVARQRAASE